LTPKRLGSIRIPPTATTVNQLWANSKRQVTLTERLGDIRQHNYLTAIRYSSKAVQLGIRFGGETDEMKKQCAKRAELRRRTSRPYQTSAGFPTTTGAGHIKRVATRRQAACRPRTTTVTVFSLAAYGLAWLQCSYLYAITAAPPSRFLTDSINTFLRRLKNRKCCFGIHFLSFIK
jgi:hypothetical protein